MYTKMNTFPMSSEHLRALNPNASKSYKQVVKANADKISNIFVENAKKGQTIHINKTIENPANYGIKIEGIEMRDFQYTQYAKDVVTEIQRNFPTSKIATIDYGNLISVTIDWSQDFINPTEMFSD